MNHQSKLYKNIYFLSWIILIVLLFPILLYAQAFSLKRINDPSQYFINQRKDWVGKKIHFLRGSPLQKEDFYFDFYWDPEDRPEFKPEYPDLVNKDGLILACYEGITKKSFFSRTFRYKNYIFWEIKLLNKEGKKVWYRDDLETPPLNFAFLHKLEEANHIWQGKTLWSRGVNLSISYPDGDSLFYIQNLEPVRIVEIKWGDFGNFPLRFIIENQNGVKGYIDENNYHDFEINWHKKNPFERYPDWTTETWDLICKKKIKPGMNFEMVRMSQGKPVQKKTFLKDGKKIDIWIYHGVNKRVYRLVFVNNKLNNMQFEDIP